MNENSKRAAGEFEIDIWKLLAAYLKSWRLIIAMTVLAAVLSLSYTFVFVTPTYRAGVTIYVNNMTGGRVDYVSGADLSASQRLVATYTGMLTSDTVLEQVIAATGRDYTPDELREYISTEQVGDTEIFRVYVCHTDPAAAAQIANAIARTAPKIISGFVEGSSTKIIDYAKVPTDRFMPSYADTALKGALAGAAIALLLLSLQVMLDVRIKEENDLSAMPDLPVLGQIPALHPAQSDHHSGKLEEMFRHYLRYAGGSGTEDHRKRTGRDEGREAGTAAKENGIFAKKRYAPEEFCVDRERKLVLGQGNDDFFYREAFNILRTNIGFSLADTENCKVIMVSSAMQNEGKSITAIDLALSIAETNGGVLLIDADMRKPKIGWLLQMTSETGLSNVLLKPALLRESIVKYKAGIDILLAGSVPPNPSELLGSARMQSLVEALRVNYDYIIVDTPPVNIVADAAAFSPWADGVLLAVRAGQSERGLLARAVKQLQYANAKIMGFVLTCVPMEKTSYGYRKYSDAYEDCYDCGGDYRGDACDRNGLLEERKSEMKQS